MQKVRISVVALGLFLWGGVGLLGDPPEPSLKERTAGEESLRLTLSSALDMAVKTNPSLAAELTRATSARGELLEARQLPNPEMEVEAPDLVDGSLARVQVTLTQEIEWAGQRRLRILASEHALERTRAEILEASRQLLAEVSRLYLEAVAADQRVQLVQRAVALDERLLEAVRAQVREGKISVLEANLAEVELGRARARVLAGQRELEGALLELGGAIGLPPSQRLEVSLPAELPTEPVPAEDGLVRDALQKRPDISALRTAALEAETRLRLAKREAVPSLAAGPLVERDQPGESPSLGIAFGLVIPLWNLNQGTIAQRRAEVERAERQREAAELELAVEVAAARRALVAARQEVDTLRSSVVGPARENQRLLEIAYEGGKIDLPSLLLVREQLVEAELEGWDAWLAWRLAAVRLQAETAAFDLTETGVLEETP